MLVRAGFGSSGLDRFRCEVLARIDEPIALEPVLLVVQLPVPASLVEQLVVRAALDDLAVLEHQNLVGAADGRQPVRDDERRAPVAAAP